MNINFDLISLILVCRKKYLGVDFISFDVMKNILQLVKDNLYNMSTSISLNFEFIDGNLPEIWSLKNIDGILCYVIDSNYNLENLWEILIGHCHNALCIAFLKDNVLKQMGLIIVDGEIIDREMYYNQLRIEYGLYKDVESGFDIFNDWERITIGGFMEKNCLYENELEVLNILRRNKKSNGVYDVLRRNKKI